MSKAIGVLGRVRAWFLIKTNDEISAEDAAKKIYDAWIYPKGVIKKSDNLVVIRADVIEIGNNNSCDFELIVPVDAQNEEDLNNFNNYLSNFGQVIVARVRLHFPKAPYLSNGFISNDEARLGIQTVEVLPESLGLTRNSPGDNPWG